MVKPTRDQQIARLQGAIDNIRLEALEAMSYAFEGDLHRTSWPIQEALEWVSWAGREIDFMYQYGYMYEEFFEPWYSELIERW